MIFLRHILTSHPSEEGRSIGPHEVKAFHRGTPNLLILVDLKKTQDADNTSSSIVLNLSENDNAVKKAFGKSSKVKGDGSCFRHELRDYLITISFDFESTTPESLGEETEKHLRALFEIGTNDDSYLKKLPTGSSNRYLGRLLKGSLEPRFAISGLGIESLNTVASKTKEVLNRVRGSQIELD